MNPWIPISVLRNYGLPSEAIEVLVNDKRIEFLNPLQVEALRKGVLSGRNAIIVAPTASGKTLIGEVVLLKKAVEKSMGLYLVPLKALASEKYAEFKVWEKLGIQIGITTGDYESPAEHLGKYDIIVATYERFDSLLRLKPSWLNKIGTVIIDEMHLINDGERGPVLEMIVSRLLSTDVQVVGLSATVGNPSELASWINGELVIVDWRPVKLVEGVYDKRRSRVIFSDGRVEEVPRKTGDAVLDVVLESVKGGVQSLVFIHNRRRTEELASELARLIPPIHSVDDEKLSEYLSKLSSESPSRIEVEKLQPLIQRGTAYHHAGLSSVARRVVEEAFKERLINVVFATPTLAAGVNLPARRVILSVKRYDPHLGRYVYIPVFEYKQMAGRAGRPQYDPYGEAIIIDASSANDGFRKYVNAEVEPVVSKLNNERSLRIHTLALIAGGEASTIEEIVKAYSTTLYGHSSRELSSLSERVEAIIDMLTSWNMVHNYSGVLVATMLGRTVSSTYIDPLSAHIFLDNINALKEKTFPYLHLITLTPDYSRSRPYIPSRIVRDFENMALMDAENGVALPPPNEDIVSYDFWLEAYVHARMLNDWISEDPEDKIAEIYGVGPGDIYSVRETASWIASSLARVASSMKKQALAHVLDALSLRIEHGVREDALELIRLEGIGRMRARTLIRAGIKSLDDLAKAPVKYLVSLPGFGRRIVINVKEQLYKMGYKVIT
ncbi:MAG: DEAD/DEAH box helicase [Desulfurococcaceae archaeon]